MWTAALAGLGFGLALIVAIGAQNAHVLRSGLRREHVGLVVAICAVSDLVLIMVGAAGLGTVIAASRTLTVVTTVLGAAVLVTYGALAARRAVRGDGALVVEGPAQPDELTAVGAAALPATSAPGPVASVHAGSAPVASAPVARARGLRLAPGTAAAAALTTLALTWLNPHVYLDTVVLLGSVAAGQGDGRWWFAAGAGLGSVLWFTALGYGAGLLRPVFARPTAWRVLDAVIAVVMVGIATGLVLGLVAPGG